MYETLHCRSALHRYRLDLRGRNMPIELVERRDIRLDYSTSDAFFKHSVQCTKKKKKKKRKKERQKDSQQVVLFQLYPFVLETRHSARHPDDYNRQLGACNRLFDVGSRRDVPFEERRPFLASPHETDTTERQIIDQLSYFVGKKAVHSLNHAGWWWWWWW